MGRDSLNFDCGLPSLTEGQQSLKREISLDWIINSLSRIFSSSQYVHPLSLHSKYTNLCKTNITCIFQLFIYRYTNFITRALRVRRGFFVAKKKNLCFYFIYIYT